MLSEELLAALPAAAQAPEGLEERLAQLVERARAAHPAVRLSPEWFCRELGRRAGTLDELESLAIEDVWLAAACARDDAGALAALDALLRDVCLGLPDTTAKGQEDVRQLVRERLLVAAGEEPARLSTYSGRGSLKAWLKVVALRVALNARRNKGDAEKSSELLDTMAAPASDPEAQYVRLRSSSDFRGAFEAAVGALEPRDRNLLRYYYVDGLGVERIGALYRVHAATASRWLSAARGKLLEGIREALRARLGLQETEIDSFVGAARSGLELSLHRILQGG
jgi:RNA polymerase sigma-70 factor (ECF subfamily)